MAKYSDFAFRGLSVGAGVAVTSSVEITSPTDGD